MIGAGRHPGAVTPWVWTSGSFGVLRVLRAGRGQIRREDPIAGTGSGGNEGVGRSRCDRPRNMVDMASAMGNAISLWTISGYSGFYRPEHARSGNVVETLKAGRPIISQVGFV